MHIKHTGFWYLEVISRKLAYHMFEMGKDVMQNTAGDWML